MYAKKILLLPLASSFFLLLYSPLVSQALPPKWPDTTGTNASRLDPSRRPSSPIKPQRRCDQGTAQEQKSKGPDAVGREHGCQIVDAGPMTECRVPARGSPKQEAMAVLMEMVDYGALLGATRGT